MGNVLISVGSILAEINGSLWKKMLKNRNAKR
jgi:hypothetical protein